MVNPEHARLQHRPDLPEVSESDRVPFDSDPAVALKTVLRRLDLGGSEEDEDERVQTRRGSKLGWLIEWESNSLPEGVDLPVGFGVVGDIAKLFSVVMVEGGRVDLTLLFQEGWKEESGRGGGTVSVKR